MRGGRIFFEPAQAVRNTATVMTETAVVATAAPLLPEGLRIYEDFIDEKCEQALLSELDEGKWGNVAGAASRRVQQFGRAHPYKGRHYPKEAPEMPKGVAALGEKLVTDRAVAAAPDQVIVNDYVPGQGIGAHIDSVLFYGPEIATVTLGSGAVMQFRFGDSVFDVYLPPRSLAVLSGRARYIYSHEIAARKTDVVNGAVVARKRRVSVTYRKMLPQGG